MAAIGPMQMEALHQQLPNKGDGQGEDQYNEQEFRNYLILPFSKCPKSGQYFQLSQRKHKQVQYEQFSNM
eukprot:CAMPEP_0117011042 /NCGR_PEP_ID=MMETSP0472-20121206/9579_1 /TAXON_ID=693140 ORGANISM="Tiarina fusus, Strain LIS" /NCGR_SAMPLE_ID=MMETSP0472 /ASSEMBLY_ACC=CAM_ASM_000603 /LENGTH=69 /DNA_ID=CAMNT_0004713729 /DNA_START=119 /DNA_END=328 /DNA_ORIENTATION=-